MEVVDFYPKCFSEIPEQDNPAFGDQACLMIVNEGGKSNRSIVLLILPSPVKALDGTEAVDHLAIFWDHELAVNFCGWMAISIELSEAVSHATDDVQDP